MLIWLDADGVEGMEFALGRPFIFLPPDPLVTTAPCAFITSCGDNRGVWNSEESAGLVWPLS